MKLYLFEFLIYTFKKHLIPAGSFRERWWNHFSHLYRIYRLNLRKLDQLYLRKLDQLYLRKLYRLYLRDGLSGVMRYISLLLRDAKPLAPAWWHSYNWDETTLKGW